MFLTTGNNNNLEDIFPLTNFHLSSAIRNNTQFLTLPTTSTQLLLFLLTFTWYKGHPVLVHFALSFHQSTHLHGSPEITVELWNNSKFLQQNSDFY